MKPCKGHNCGCTDGISHSVECRLEHAISYTGVEKALIYIEEYPTLLEKYAELERKLADHHNEVAAAYRRGYVDGSKIKEKGK